MFEYNRISSAPAISYLKPFIMRGTSRYSINAIQNSNIYGKPRILSTEHSAISSSIFLNSKPDAIMNIDILLESTVLSKKIWNHDYFVPDIGISLRSLGSFFTFSEVATLNVKNS
ncbi:hypothetical protein BDF21DRAFT_435206, partial [Thamnidium elegans]